MARAYILKKAKQRKDIDIDTANRSLIRDRERHRKIPCKYISIKLFYDVCMISAVMNVFVHPSTGRIHCTHALETKALKIYPTTNRGKIQLGSRRAKERLIKQREATRDYKYKKVLGQYTEVAGWGQ